MGKKVQERSSSSAKENASCAWSFFNIFEFSHSYGPRKLLVNRKLWSARYPGNRYVGNSDLEYTCEAKNGNDANDVDVCGATTAHSYLPSVRTLLEEEMSKEKISKSFGYNFELDQKITRDNKNDPDPLTNNLLVSTQEVLEQLTCIEPVECSNFILDLAALMVEFYSVCRHCPDIYAEKDAEVFTSSRSSYRKKNIRLVEPEYRLVGHSMLHDALVIEAEVFLRQKIDDAKRLVRNGVIRSQKFTDALEILNSNKELFLKLIQDPHSLIFKHIQELLKQPFADFSKLDGDHCLEESVHFEDKHSNNSDQIGKSSRNKAFQKQRLQIFSKHKNKGKGKIASKDRSTLEEMSRIVVLKPRLSRNHGDSAIDGSCTYVQSDTNKLEKYSEKFVSHFSFREIKRKLRHIIGESRKEQHLMSRDGLLQLSRKHKMKADCKSESTCQSSPAIEEIQVKSKKKKWQISIKAQIARAEIEDISPVSPLHGESFSKEADKHFLEKLCTDYTTVNLTNKTNSLKEMLSLSDDMYSPRFSPHLLKELTLSPELTVSSPKLQFCETPSWNETRGSSSDLDVEMLLINSVAEVEKAELQDETCIGGLNRKGIVEIIEIENVESVHINLSEPYNTPNVSAACTGNSFSSERCKGEECSMPSEQSAPNEKPRILIPASVSPCSLIIHDFVSSESIIEKPERPSPVSVLEPFFIEDDASPDHSSIGCAELQMPLPPIYLNNNNEDSVIIITTTDCSTPHQRCSSYDIEAIISYVRAALETYSFNSEITPERLSSSELRELSSYQEDPNLFLDYINEAFLETKDRLFQIYPCIVFLDSTVRPFLKDLIIHEVCKTIESYLGSQLQRTLDDIMRKDMGSTMWMNLGFQVESITAEIGGSIFEELMEETMFELFL